MANSLETMYVQHRQNGRYRRYHVSLVCRRFERPTFALKALLYHWATARDLTTKYQQNARGQNYTMERYKRKLEIAL